MYGAVPCPINLDDLIRGRLVEGDRVEFTRSLNNINEKQIVKSIVAFANDLHNLNGGYILIGIAEDENGPIFPPCGVSNVDACLKRVFELCKKMTPQYQVRTFVETVQDAKVVVLWASGGDNRPYATEGKYYVRQGAVTAEARGALLPQLLEQTARIPFDCRKHLTARVEDISPMLVRKHLKDVRSSLVDDGMKLDEIELYRRMDLLVPVNVHSIPRNVALLFFTEKPNQPQYFPGAAIEIVEFGEPDGGDTLNELVINGPLPVQIKTALEYLNGKNPRHIQKVPLEAEAETYVAFPLLPWRKRLQMRFIIAGTTVFWNL